ncbi:MAG: hypothetical protein IJH90_02290 [Mogibacterium sp.]|nr:hypothetical protein [Mogibacterium sp.]
MDNNQKASTAANREKKRVRREAKAARKAANVVKEKESRPNNVLLAIMIFGVLIGMFVFVKGYNYFSKEANLEKYIANNGGEETYGSMAIDQNTTAAITAEGNSMKIVLDTVAEGEDVDTYKEFYSGDDGKDQLEYIGAYFLTSMKSNTRGFSADVTVTSNINGEEVNSVSLTLKEAKKVLEPDEEDAEAAEAEESEDESSEDAAEETEDAAEGESEGE